MDSNERTARAPYDPTLRVAITPRASGHFEADRVGGNPAVFTLHEINYGGAAEVRYAAAEYWEQNGIVGADEVAEAADSLLLAAYWREMVRLRLHDLDHHHYKDAS